MMPVMNGMVLIRALRAIDPVREIIATSGLSELPQRLELAALDVPDVLLKPYEQPMLLEAVNRRAGRGLIPDKGIPPEQGAGRWLRTGPLLAVPLPCPARWGTTSNAPQKRQA